MTARPTTIPPAMVSGIEFRCYVVPDAEPNELGLFGEHFEWRSVDGRCKAARNTGTSTWRAAADGRVIGRDYAKGRLAMAAAVYAAHKEAAA